ncbi:hypothetical protein [Methanospirillum hungatei]|uniref:hypothetical protein n=1 Tax=Methanospirillum hungatei TaxID=2203 RepID=UPI0026F01069|nr:hypothetical protein [Methanospirillum hungatei]MCA1917525.1 hypothetical protein [Methanospirillum hungatei]
MLSSMEHVNVFVKNDYAFLVSLLSNALYIIDLSDPTARVHAYRVADGNNGARVSEPRGIFVPHPYVSVTSIGSNALEIAGFPRPSPTPPPTIPVITRSAVQTPVRSPSQPWQGVVLYLVQRST